MPLQAFIINRDRLTCVRRMSDWLRGDGVDVIIVDNASTYPPLLDWYAQGGVRVMRNSCDFGHTAPWETGLLARMGRGEFILTDSDLDLSQVPADWLARLREGLAIADVPKCGLSIEINDLPDHFPLKQQVLEWEVPFWRDRVGQQYFNAAVDTTFALYRGECRCRYPGRTALRTDRPYTARHLPWYVDADQLDEEEAYYIDHAGPSSTYALRMRHYLDSSPSFDIPASSPVVIAATADEPQPVESVEKSIKRVAIVFDDAIRPDTTGVYCARALAETVEATHVRPSQIDELKSGEFDLFLFIDDGLDYPLPPTLHPSALWAIDTHINPARILKRAQSIDFVFAAQKPSVDVLRAGGVECLGWLPLACDPAVHRKWNTPKCYDACFVGNFSDRRKQMTRLLEHRFPSAFVGHRFFDSMALTYSASKVVLNLSINGDLNMRVFEALACGSLLLTDELAPASGLAELFRDGTHLVTYRDESRMLEIVDYFCRDEELREHIARAGRREVLAKHTYAHRMRELLRRVGEQLWPGRARPHWRRVPARNAPAPPPTKAGTTGSIGCVTAVRNRAVEYLERAFQTHAWQFPIALDRVLLDYGSDPVYAVGYRDVCHRFGWRYVRAEPEEPRWSSSRAYNIAVRALQPEVDVVFKCDADLLLGDGIVEAAALFGCDRYCVFKNVYSTAEGTAYPETLNDSSAVADLVAADPPVRRMEADGVVAFPRAWFAEVGGFDEWYTGWGFEDSDLRVRAERTIGVYDEPYKLLVHQWHPRQVERGQALKNHAYFTARRAEGSVVRNRDSQEWAAHVSEIVRSSAEAAGAPSLTSIIILTHNELAHTIACLESIARCTSEPIEIIVVDNASTDGTIEFLRSRPDLRVIFNEENRGFPAAANQGIGIASGEQILLLNNDVIVTPGWLGRLLRALRLADDVGIVGPCSNRVSGSQQVSIPYDDLDGLDRFARQRAVSHDGQVSQTDRLVGFCLLFRQRLVWEIGLLDERFGLGTFEDDDFCRRTVQAGYRLLVAQDAFVHHHCSATFEGQQVDQGSLLAENRRLFEDKWGMRRGLEVCPVARSEQVPDPPNVRGRPTISLCMIVRDSARTLDACLSSIKGWVDEMVVVDTGSRDQTMQIAQSHGARVFEFPWCDDFAAARNESVRHATGDWVFWMDSDDTMDAANAAQLRKLIDSRTDPHILGFVMQVHCPARDGDGDGDSVTVVDHIKLFRNLPSLRFEGRIHEQVLPSIRRAGGEVAWTEVFVRHSGSDQSDVGRARKQSRDLRLLELELRDGPGHPFTIFNLGMTYADAGRHEDAVAALERSRASSGLGESHLRKVYALLAGSFFALRRLREAAGVCVGGLRLFPDDPELLFRLAVLRQVGGDCAGAADCYRSLLANAPGPRHFSSIDRGIRGFKARHNFALLEAEAGQYESAAALWRAATAEAPTFRAAWYGLVDALIQLRRFREAEEACDRMADVQLRGDALAVQAKVADAQQMPVVAAQLRREAREAGPKNPEFLTELARDAFETGDLETAERTLLDLIGVDPSDATAHHNLGSVYATTGRLRESKASYRRSLELRPGAEKTRRILARLECDAGID